MTPTVTAVVSYSHMERAFLPHVLRECGRFARGVVVVYGDKYTDGTLQPPPDAGVVQDFPDVQFRQYIVEPPGTRHALPMLHRQNAYWMNVARYIGWAVAPETDYVLFLDADEVPEGERFAAFLAAMPSGDAAADAPHLKLANWWYFRYPWLRSPWVEDSVVMVPRASLTADRILCASQERDDLVDPARVRRRVVDQSRTPMFHHYSWVRTREDLYRKVRTWSHKDDADWAAALDRDLASPVDHRPGATRRDPVHDRQLVVVQPHFDITLEPRRAVYYTVGCNPGFARLFGASCRSLRRWHPAGDVDVYVLCEPAYRGALEEHAPGGELGYTVVVDADGQPSDVDCAMRKLSPPACLSAYDKVLYLDCDIVVCGPLDAAFGAVREPGVLYVCRESGPRDHAHPHWSMGLHSEETLADLVRRDVGVFNSGQFGFVPGEAMDAHFAAVRRICVDHGVHFADQPPLNHHFATRPGAVSYDLSTHVYLNATADDVKPDKPIAHFMGWGRQCDDKLGCMARYLAAHERATGGRPVSSFFCVPPL